MPITVGTFQVLRHLPDNYYYTVIGKILFDFSYMENLLRDCVYMLLRLDRKKGRIAVRSPRPAEILTMIEELMSELKYKTDVKTSELKKSLIKASNVRDMLAHGVWVNHPGSKLPVLQVISGSWVVEESEPKVKARLQPVSVETSTADLNRTALEIRFLSSVVESLRKNIVDQAGPLPEIPQQPVHRGQ
jgi:hypothetical protein